MAGNVSRRERAGIRVKIKPLKLWRKRQLVRSRHRWKDAF